MALLFKLLGQESIHRKFLNLNLESLTRENAFEGLFGSAGIFQNDFSLRKDVEIKKCKLKNKNFSWPSLNAWLLVIFNQHDSDKLSAGVAIGNWMIDGKSSDFVYMDNLF